ncbi:uncharacterized protein LOC124488554 [Hypomesus transpacificus]|uniref:uncharacterized protein LOC124488554 n=1 Tax=Hypomesus transpacificus TaxID=137520 RepID=UPI001F076F4D|nr:uncharacterized protein LOC124488554 [Hypomesus transpacificus]
MILKNLQQLINGIVLHLTASPLSSSKASFSISPVSTFLKTSPGPLNLSARKVKHWITKEELHLLKCNSKNTHLECHTRLPTAPLLSNHATTSTVPRLPSSPFPHQLQVLDTIGLAGVVSPLQARKKWDNLKTKYKELKCSPTGTGASTMGRIRLPRGHGTLPWMSCLARGPRASLPCCSSMAEPNSMGALSSPPRSASSSPPGEESSQEVSKKRRYTLALVGEMMERAEALEIERQRREVERQKRADVRLDRLLAVMERLAEK